MMTPIPQFTAPSYGNRHLSELQSCVNWFPEKMGDGFQLVGTAGLKLLSTMANNLPCRGAIYVIYNGTGRIYSVHGAALYRINYDGTATTISASGVGGSRRVSMAYNGLHLCIVDGLDGYGVTMSSEAFATIADASFPASPGTVTFQDGRFIINDENTGQFYLSELNSFSDWTPQTFATAEGDPDDLRCAISNATYLYLIGSKVSEVWYNTQNADFTYERVNGAILPAGTSYFATVAQIGGSIFFIGSGSVGRGSVWMISGTTLAKISTPAVEADVYRWNSSTSFGFCYEERGHTFYQITDSSTGLSTWCYDIGLGVWHKKTSSALGYHRASIILNAYQHGSPPTAGLYAFDTANGKIYTLDPTYNSEDGAAIVRTRDFGPIGTGDRAFHRRIRFTLQADHDSSINYILSATLSWTDNGGRSYSSGIALQKEIADNTGTTGQRLTLEANRLGSGPERYYRLVTTGPSAQMILKKCELDLQQGRF